jgi:hypothetical protein
VQNIGYDIFMEQLGIALVHAPGVMGKMTALYSFNRVVNKRAKDVPQDFSPLAIRSMTNYLI